MSTHHRHCAIPDCRRHAIRGKATCRHHLGHPDGRLLNQQTRRLAKMLSDLNSPDDLDPETMRAHKHKVRSTIERGDFNVLLAPTLTELMEHARAYKDLSWLIGANKVAITRLLVDTEDPYKLSLALCRLVNQNSRLITERAKPIDRRREPAPSQTHRVGD